jgi:hypothetical protein
VFEKRSSSDKNFIQSRQTRLGGKKCVRGFVEKKKDFPMSKKKVIEVLLKTKKIFR